MRRLEAQLKREARKEIAKTRKELKELKTLEDIFAVWFYKNLLPKSKKVESFTGVIQARKYLIERLKKRTAERLEKKLHRLKTVMAADDVKSITITVEYRKNRTWGYNPKAFIKVESVNGYFERFESSSIGGCGYDKESTAIAEALNQCNGLLKKLYRLKNKRPADSNRDVIAYGCGYGILPSFEGGVGVSCMYNIAEALKMKFESVASGKTFNVYQLRK